MLSMISEQEKEYLYEFAKNEYTAQGEIVDLGCWMGASIVLLAQGLQENSNLKARTSIINAYDRFIWEDWMNPYVFNTPLQGKYKWGESFFEECVNNTFTWKNQIKFYSGDICQIGWRGNAIEFLFIDVMKNWELCNSVIHDFFPSLIEKVSLVVHQDFSHYYTYWIHLIMYRFREYFQPIKEIKSSGSFVFKYQKTIPEDLLKEVYSLSSFSVEEVRSAFNYSRSLISEENLSQIIAAEVIALMELNEPHHVGSELYQIIQPYILRLSSKTQLDKAQSDLQQELTKSASLWAEVCQLKEEITFSQTQLQQTQQELESSQTQLQQTQQELETTQTQLQQTQQELETSQRRISAMELSKFWKLRTLWFKIKTIFSGSQES